MHHDEWVNHMTFVHFFSDACTHRRESNETEPST